MLVTEITGEARFPWSLAPEIPVFDQAGSSHPQGSNVAFADGHVQFVTKKADVTVQPFPF